MKLKKSGKILSLLLSAVMLLALLPATAFATGGRNPCADGSSARNYKDN